MTPSKITDGQIDKIADQLRYALRKHRDEFGSEAVQQILGTDNLGMRLLEPFRKLVEAVSDLIVRNVAVGRSLTPQEALTATGRKQYVDDEVVATMPRGEGNEGETVFFKLDRWVSDDELKKEYELRGLIPEVPYTLAAINAADPAFADNHPSVTHWRDAGGRWCYVAFRRWHDERRVYVRRYDGQWHDSWWFAGRRDCLRFSPEFSGEFCLGGGSGYVFLLARIRVILG